MVAEVSHLPGSTGKGISELSLRTAGSFLQGREAGCATLHFWKSLCCKNYFPAEFFIRAGSIAASSTPQWPASVLFWGQNSPFSVPPRLELFLCFSRSFCAPFRARGVFALRLCWMLPWCHAVYLQGVLLWRLPSSSVIASSSSFSLSKNGLEHSLYIPNVTNAESTSLFFLSILILHCGRFWIRSWDVSVHELCWELHRHIRKTIQYFWSVRLPAVRSAATVGGWNAGTQGANSTQYCILVVIFQPEGW